MPIHPTAIVDPQAEIDPTAEIGPHVIIEGPVEIGAGTKVGPFSHILGNTLIGERCKISSRCTIGDVPQDRGYKGEVSYVVIGNDTVIREGSTVHRATGEDNATVIGDRCYLMTNAHVGHNCHVANDATLISGCLLGGHVTVGERAVISGNCAVHQFVRIGTLAMIAGVTAVVQDIPPFMMTDHAGRLAGVNTVGLRRAGYSAEERAEIKEVYRLLYRTSIPAAQILTQLSQREMSRALDVMMKFLGTSTARGLCRGNLKLRAA